MKAVLIPFENILLGFIPLIFVFVVFFKWEMDWKKLLIASARMLGQLIIIGYFLKLIFTSQSLLITIPLVIIMLVISAWIALHNIPEKRMVNYKYAVLAMFLGALPNLLLTTIVLIPHTPWYAPSFIIPLAGMALSQAMNALGLCSERFQTELENHDYEYAKIKAMQASLIPVMNSFMAVGLVSIPGMMTGQILAGVDPLVAVRYQILIMTMVMGSGAMSSYFYLKFLKPTTPDRSTRLEK